MKARLRTFSWLVLLVGMAGGLSSCDNIKQKLSEIPDRFKRVDADPVVVAPPDPLEVLADVPFTVIPPPPTPVEEPIVIDKEAQVSILGYHDFTDGNNTTQMIINVDKFRQQMQSLADSGIPVISMEQFLAWRRGEENIPEQCVMITIDDGWEATHTLAMPVLREFGFPYTVFLYKNYLGGAGRSLSYQQVREIMQSGGVVGSHSVSHQNMLEKKRLGPEAYRAWLKVELEESYNYLGKAFGKDGKVLKVFAYPYGIYSDEIVQMAEDFGYEASFTVDGKKTNWDSPKHELGRYIVHGDNDQNFTFALTFKGSSVLAAGRKLLEEASATEEGEAPKGPVVTTLPKDGETIVDRLPAIEMNVTQLEQLDPESIRMRISSLGEVPCQYDPAAGVIRYKVSQRLRQEDYTVLVDFRFGENQESQVISWTFHLDRVGAYLAPPAEKSVADQEESPKQKPGPVANPETASLPSPENHTL